MLISIIIPCYNEINTIDKIIDSINNINLIEKEIIIVDDFSNDGSKELLKNKIRNKKNIKKILYHNKNMGKGSAIKTALDYVSGKIVIIQDADLEYNPNDYYKLIEPIQKKEALVVYGSRVLKGGKRIKPKHFVYFLSKTANLFLTILTNYLTSQRLTDAHTCYKVFSTDILKKIIIEEKGFSVCAELTMKTSKLKIKIKEVPIDYFGRTYKEGKKIRWTDFFVTLYCLFKHKFKKLDEN
jgi:dolichol-phosphate mannosyltransferase